MAELKEYIVPVPMVNKKEKDSLVSLTERYNSLIKPGKLAKIGTKIGDIIPEPVKKIGNNAKESITEPELFAQCMKVVAEGFSIVEKQAAKMTISEESIIKKINSTLKDNEITELEEVCLARSYNISKLVGKYKTQDLGFALVEGGVTGYFGFAGLPFNLVLSIFLYYRAVQSVAMFYGYDVKNDADELIIASQVFMNALSPSSKGASEMGGIIGKIMLITEMTAVKQTAKKTWTDMAARGGMSLLLAQMRALAHKSAKTALEKAGKKGLENNLFKEMFEQIGKKLTKKTIGKAIPVAGAVIGALFDTAQMNTVLEYTDVFYNKRYILEKELRINILLGIEEADVIIEDISDDEVIKEVE